MTCCFRTEEWREIFFCPRHARFVVKKRLRPCRGNSFTPHTRTSLIIQRNKVAVKLRRTTKGRIWTGMKKITENFLEKEMNRHSAPPSFITLATAYIGFPSFSLRNTVLNLKRIFNVSQHKPNRLSLILCKNYSALKE